MAFQKRWKNAAILFLSFTLVVGLGYMRPHPVGAANPILESNRAGRNLSGPDNLGEFPLQNRIKIHFGATQQAPIAITIEGERVWLGSDMGFPPIYRLENNRLITTRDHRIQYTLSNGRIFRGDGRIGEPAYRIDGNRVFYGNTTTGVPLATCIGQHMYMGGNAGGSILLTANTNLEGTEELLFILTVMLFERYTF